MNSDDKAKLKHILADESKLLASVQGFFPHLRPLDSLMPSDNDVLKHDCAARGYVLYGQLGSGSFGQVCKERNTAIVRKIFSDRVYIKPI